MMILSRTITIMGCVAMIACDGLSQPLASLTSNSLLRPIGTLPPIGKPPSGASFNDADVAQLVTPSVPIGTLPGTAGVSANGEATYRIPIEVPRGRAGMEPRLAITYSSGSASGPLGIGFGLRGISEIRHCPLDSLHPDVVHPNAVDLCFGGRLLLVSGSHHEVGAIYRVHGTPGLRIQADEMVDTESISPTMGDSLRTYTVSYPNGNVAHFGASGDSNVAGRALITSMEDRSGNSIRYEYTVSSDQTEVLPGRIHYTLSQSTNKAYPTEDNGTREILFGYEYRPQEDRFAGYRSMGQGAVGVYRRLFSIRTLVNGNLVHQYNFQYKNNSITQRSLLVAIEKCDAQDVCLPYTLFEWELGTEGYMGHVIPEYAQDSAPNFKDIAASVMMDVDHDGKMELLFAYDSLQDHSASRWNIWDPETGFNSTPVPAYLVEGSAALAPSVADFNGDGVADLVAPFCTDAECRDHSLDPMQYEYANSVMILLGDPSDPDGLAQPAAANVAMNTQDRVFIAHVAEIDGDGYPDMFVCQGDQAILGTWYLLLNRPAANPLGRRLVPHATRRRCNASELYQVMDADGDGRDELWVPRMNVARFHPGTMHMLDPSYALSPSNWGMVQYAGLELPHRDNNGMIVSIDEALQSLTHVSKGNTTRWPESGIVNHTLPMDFSQRILQGCWKPDGEETMPAALFAQIQTALGLTAALEIAELYHHPGRPFVEEDVIPNWLHGGNLFSFNPPPTPTQIPANAPFVQSGPGRDLKLDINGDGQTDIARIVVLDNDEEVQVYSQPYDNAPAYCNADQEFDFGLKLFLNTGKGFDSAGIVTLLEDEQPWRAAQFLARISPIDFNSDGRSDFLMPNFAEFKASGAIDQWQILVAELTGSSSTPVGYHPVGVPVPANHTWYDGTYEWSQLLEEHIAAMYKELGYEHSGSVDIDEFPQLTSRSTTTIHLTDHRLQDIIFFPGADAIAGVHALRKAGNRPDYLVRVTNGLGAISEWDYKSGYDRSVFTKTEGTKTAMSTTPSMVVSERRRDTGIGSTVWMRYQYRYYGAFASRRGLGGLGIGVKYVDQIASGETQPQKRTMIVYGQTTEFDPDHYQYPFVGLVTDSITGTHFERADDTRRYIHERNNEWDVVEAPNSNFTIVLRDRTQAEYDVHNNINVDNACKHPPCHILSFSDETPIKTQTTRAEEFDELGNVTVQSVQNGDGVRTETHTSYLNQASIADEPYAAGLVTFRRITDETPDGAATREVETSYDPVTLRRVQETREPNQQDGPLWRETTTFHDVRGNVARIEVRASNELRTSTTQWDHQGYFPARLVNPKGHPTRIYWHQGHEVPAITVSPNLAASKTCVDGFGRPTCRRQTDASDTSIGEEFTYQLESSPNDFLTGTVYRWVTSRNGVPQLVVDFDRLRREKRRIWRVFNGINEWGDEYQKITDYDVQMNKSKQSIPLPTALLPGPIPGTEYFYDRLNRLVETTKADGSTETYTRVDRDVSHQDASGDRVWLRYNQLGQLVEREQGSMTTCFDYGAFGTLVRTRRNCTEADGLSVRTVSQSFDAWNRPEFLEDNELGNRTKVWDGFDQLVTMVDGSGEQLSFDYDSLGRLIARTTTDGTATWDYDLHPNGIGKLIRTTSENDTVVRRYSYDSFGRTIESVTETNDYSFSVRTEYQGNRVNKIDYPVVPLGGTEIPFRIRYAYDLYGHVTHIYDDVSFETLWQLEGMDGWGHITRERAAKNDFFTEYVFDPMTGRQNMDAVVDHTGTPISARGYIWTDDGNLYMKTDLLSGQEQIYEYDVLDQLRFIAEDGVIESVEYDVFGNITQKEDVGSYHYDPNTGRLATAGNESFLYDENGNLRVRGTGTDVSPFAISTQFSWTATGKLESAVGGSSGASFVYDADGVEVRKMVFGGNDTIQVGPLFQHVTSFTGTTEWRYGIYIGDKPVAQASRTYAGGLQTTLHYLHRDYRGSITATSHEDGSFQLSDYDPWGAKINGQKEPFTSEPVAIGFTGHDSELVAGLIDMRARYYDPRLGRFQSADTLIPNPSRGLDWNRYAYVRNNPLRYIDPSGHAAVPHQDPPDDEISVSGHSGNSGDSGCFSTLDALWCDANSRWADYADSVYNTASVVGIEGEVRTGAGNNLWEDDGGPQDGSDEEEEIVIEDDETEIVVDIIIEDDEEEKENTELLVQRAETEMWKLNTQLAIDVFKPRPPDTVTGEWSFEFFPGGVKKERTFFGGVLKLSSELHAKAGKDGPFTSMQNKVTIQEPFAGTPLFEIGHETKVRPQSGEDFDSQNRRQHGAARMGPGGDLFHLK